MSTEEEIIYLIWDKVKSGQINQDDRINERLMRAFLRSHRGKHIDKFYDHGDSVSDELFQPLEPLKMSFLNGVWVSPILPKIIKLTRNSGMFCDIDGYPLSVVGREEFDLSKNTTTGKHIPLLKHVSEKLYLSTGSKVNHPGSALNNLVELLSPGGIYEKEVYVNVNAILVDPDDSPGYDFSESAYPFPNEAIEDLINSVEARDFNLFLRMKSDKVGNLEDDVSDNIR